MSLNPEWKGRINHWLGAMSKLFYIKLGTLDLEGFLTHDQLTVDEAAKKSFKSMKPGTKWGSKWQYGWFKTTVKLPSEARGEQIVFVSGAGSESAIYVDGDNIGAWDRQHKEIILSQKGVPGKKYEVMIEAYGGHGISMCGGGPVPYGVESVSEPGETQVEVVETSFGIWEEEMYQLWIDAMTLWELREHMADRQSLRVQEIDRALKEMTVAVDLELPRAEMMKTVKAGRVILKPLLACKNGSTAPTLYAFGHSHIDVAWLWPLRETESKCCRTFGTQLDLIDQYPEFTFLQSQPHLYWMVKTKYPKLYERVKKAVKKGNWIPDGGMWVEADTNVTSGESLIRQFVHGKRFFKEEFGVNSEMMWLPDVFGYSGAMPQIMTGCGIKYFSTQKIFWNYGGGHPFPYNSFWWEGIDGTRLFAHFHNDYNSQASPRHLIDRWNDRRQKDGLISRMLPYGWGDGGGGPTRNHLEYLRRLENLEGMPKVKHCRPVDYFKDEEKRNWDMPTYVGELYLQVHRGTYTTQAKTKKGNRKSEFALREAEMWGAAACALSGYAYPLALVDELWKQVLLNQFHDIIPGSSIARVYEQAEAGYARVISEAGKTAQAAAATFLSDNKDSVTVFNSLSFDRDALVELPKGFQGAEDENGNALPAQKIGSAVYALAPSVPSCGWTTLEKAKPAEIKNTLKASSAGLENELLKIKFDKQGEITSILDKESGRELAAGACNSFRMYKDVPNMFDAWDIESPYRECPVDISGPAKVEVVAAGPLIAILKITKKLNGSELVQEVKLAAGSRRVDFDTTVDWREKHKLLKVNFPVDIRSSEAIHEIQFGHLSRPTHESNQFDADRFEVCNQKWTAISENSHGVAILNDCKYGIDVNGNSINLTLLKSAIAPDMNADQGEQKFVYSFYAWNGSFGESEVVEEAYDLNIPVTSLPGAGGTASLFRVDQPNIIIEAVKPAEDGSGDIVLRLYEAKRMRTECELSTCLPVSSAMITDMLEENGKKVACKNGAIELAFHPFEIKTLRLKV